MDSESKRKLVERLGGNYNEEAFQKLLLADNFFELKNYKEAIKYYSEAINITPNNSYPLDKRGKCYQLIREYDSALIDLYKSKEIEDGFECNETIGICYIYKKEFENALKYLNSALFHLDDIELIDKLNLFHYNGMRARILNNMANCYNGLKKYREAIENCTLSIHYNNNYTNPYLLRACIYQSINKNYEGEQYEQLIGYFKNHNKKTCGTIKDLYSHFNSYM